VAIEIYPILDPVNAWSLVGGKKSTGVAPEDDHGTL
jgi:hypothetical protein